MPILIRQYRDGDSIRDITTLLNRAYAALAEQGLRYVASWQTPEMTLERIHMGTCFVAIDDHRLVGTVMLYPPDLESECEFYRRPGVYHFGKFGVDPDRQGEGIGKMLFDELERHASEVGATTLACDTAIPATHLIDIYESWGFQVIGHQNWSMTNYESVIMSKSLARSPQIPEPTKVGGPRL